MRGHSCLWLLQESCQGCVHHAHTQPQHRQWQARIPATNITFHTAHGQGLPSPGATHCPAWPCRHMDPLERIHAVRQAEWIRGEPSNRMHGSNNSRHGRAVSALGLPSALHLQGQDLHGCSASVQRGWSRHSACEWGDRPGVWSSSQTCTTGVGATGQEGIQG